MTAKKKKPIAGQLRSEQHEAALDEYEKGIRLFQQHDYQKAIPRFEAILANFPTEAALCDRSRAYLAIARRSGQPAMAVAPTRDPAESRGVGLYMLNTGDYRDAITHLERASGQFPADAEIAVALASARLQLADVDGCLAALKRALELDPRLLHPVRSMSDFASLREHPEFVALCDRAA